MPKLVDHDSRRQQLAHAAAGVIARDGLNGASLRDVAAAGGVTTGAVTHYFPGRTDLIAAAYEQVMGRIVDRLDGTPLDSLADADALVGMLSGFLPHDAQTRSEWRVWLAFSAEALVDPVLSARHRAHYAAILARIAADFGPDGPDGAVRADLLVAIIDGLAIRILLEPEDWPPARVRATLGATLSLF
jgi:TetR/AcrR family transcriptional regulator, transcriptional repressor of bet genes